MPMLTGLSIILCCQLAGEVMVQLLGLPVPGPVIGMLLLFTGLVVRGGPPPAVRSVAETFLRYLPLLFVPAGVGLMAHFQLIGREWLPLLAALFISTILTLAVTMLVLRFMPGDHRRRD